MKRILIICAAALLALLAACAAQTPVTEAPAADDAPTEAIPSDDAVDDGTLAAAESAARQAAADLAMGNFDVVTASFDETMAQSLTAGQLQAAWEGAVAQAGEYAEIISTEASLQDGYYVCLVTARHSVRDVVSRVVYDKDMKIAGLFFSYTDNEGEGELRAGETSVTVGEEYPLNGVLALPPGGEKVPAVVLVHGSGPSDMDESAYGIKVFQDISDYLAAAGVAVLRYDKRTYAHADKLAAANITAREETIEDAIMAGRLLAQNERIDATKIFVVGHSFGGMLAPRIVAESDGVFAGAVIMAGSPRSLLDIVYNQNMYFISLADPSEREALTRQVEDAKPYYGLPQGYIDEMDARPAGEYLLTTDKPFLILQGGKDFQVSPDKDFEAYKELVGDKSNFEFHLYDNLNHFFILSTMENPTTDDYIAGTHVDGAPLADMAAWLKAQGSTD